MIKAFIIVTVFVAACLATDQGYICYRYVNENDKFYNLNNLATADQ